jgi:hypothetical protein
LGGGLANQIESGHEREESTESASHFVLHPRPNCRPRKSGDPVTTDVAFKSRRLRLLGHPLSRMMTSEGMSLQSKRSTSSPL